ncbi:MAG: 30S ribosomal protein S12 methylthiotransferase RimO, partial [Clostridia bacterium]|nr:30S ribosomal protein S12 methylthiotransferase RimO [Clostridia bacterium]
MAEGVKVGFVSLGCSKNRVDTEEILGELTLRGFVPETDPAEAEVIVVNTCGFIESAKEDSLDAVFEMARYKAEGACRLLVVCGCLSERYYEALQEE